LSGVFGKFFNLIYTGSNSEGRVVAHFTLYNVIAWHVVLAEAGGTPNSTIAIASNPLDPSVWSDTVTDEFPIDFAWLDNPEYQLERAGQRLTKAIQHHVEATGAQEMQTIIRQVFEENGVPENSKVTDPETIRKITTEVAQRTALHAFNLPHVEKVPGGQIIPGLVKE
jgi:hypothetical protein